MSRCDKPARVRAGGTFAWPEQRLRSDCAATTWRYSSQRDEFHRKGNGFGRAVSRFLSAFLRRRESFVLAANTRNPSRLRETWSGPLRGSLFGLAPDGVFRAASLALRAVRSYRTFSPLPRPRCRDAGRFVFCGTVRRDASRRPPPACISDRTRSYAASRPMEFGLSSPGLRRERFSALPKPVRRYAIPRISSRPEFPTAQIARATVGGQLFSSSGSRRRPAITPRKQLSPGLQFLPQSLDRQAHDVAVRSRNFLDNEFAVFLDRVRTGFVERVNSRKIIPHLRAPSANETAHRCSRRKSVHDVERRWIKLTPVTT